MELERIAEKIKDLILGEIKEELKDLRTPVIGELTGFRLVIESMSTGMSGIEARGMHWKIG